MTFVSKTLQNKANNCFFGGNLIFTKFSKKGIKTNSKDTLNNRIGREKVRIGDFKNGAVFDCIPFKS